MLEPDFKPWPTMEDYTLSLITWMTAMEYAAEGNTQQVKQTYGLELQKHINFLSVRPGWNDLVNEPETLPENIKKRVTGSFESDKYPDKKICYFHEYSQDTMAREVRYIQTLNYPTQVDNVLCTVPQGFVNLRHTSGEEHLESAYGTQLMAVLAEKLARLKTYGTVREQFIGTFGATPANYQPMWVYVIRNDGALLWNRKDTGAAPWQGPKVVGSGWNFKDVIAAGGNSLYALTADGKLLWYQHMGFNDGRVDWKGPVEIGHGWTFSQIFSGGEGIVYAIRQDGKLIWYRHGGWANGGGVNTWTGPKEVGSGWGDFKDVFSTGQGAVYAVTKDGKLLLYQQKDYINGVKDWQPAREVGSGWQSFRQIVPIADGVILAITNDGKLLWYKHDGLVRDSASRVARLKEKWQGPVEIGSGWRGFRKVIALIPAAIPVQVVR